MQKQLNIQPNELKRRNMTATRISTSREMKVPDNRLEEGIFMQTQVNLDHPTALPSRNLNAKSAGTTRNLKYL